MITTRKTTIALLVTRRKIKVLNSILCCMIFGSGFAQPVVYSDLFHSDFARTIDVSRPVGSTAGAPRVSSGGAATYTIPIKVPVGTGGLQPSISVNYNSQGGNGILGQGWSLEGLSIITRVGNDIYHP